METTKLENFVGRGQLSVMLANCRGEERKFFKTMILELKNTIENMPQTYGTEGQGAEATATLHYFKGDSDWYIIEKDAGDPDDDIPGVQAQAFGFACLNGDKKNAEMGYISIQELIENGVELDLYYHQKTIGAIKDKYNKN